jgi:hypothetical protein
MYVGVPQSVSWRINRPGWLVDARVVAACPHVYPCVSRSLSVRLPICTCPYAPPQTPIMKEILDHCLDLIHDQYGNYVIQHVLEHGLPWQRSSIVKSVQSDVLALAKHKFASNVVEKCFVFGSDADRTALVDEIIGSNTDGQAPIAAMVRDQYANYVVQKTIDVTSGPIRLKFIEGLKHKVPGLRKITYGKHIISRIEKITGKPF